MRIRQSEPYDDTGTWGRADAFRHAGQPQKHAFGEKPSLPLGWVGDRSMFIVLVDYEHPIVTPAGTFARFLMLSNSEVGAGSLKITFGLLDYACCNFILWGCSQVYEAAFRHTKSVHEKWAALSAGFSRQLESGERDSIITGITLAQKQLLGGSEPSVLAVTRAATDLPAELVQDGFNPAARTPPYGDPRSVSGMVNGLTEASQHATVNADKRAQIDAKAARLMGLLK
jgi:hypothetical protein